VKIQFKISNINYFLKIISKTSPERSKEKKMERKNFYFKLRFEVASYILKILKIRLVRPETPLAQITRKI
jgi:hypothetical protein